MAARTVTLDTLPLSAQEVAQVARRRAELVLGDAAIARVQASRDLVDRFNAMQKPFYGLNTGLGASVDTPLKAEELVAFQRRVAHSHCVGIGPALPVEDVRAMMVARISGMAAGGTGTSERVVRGLVTALNTGLHPVIPSWGSIGAADLAPLAHMANALLGEGEIEFRGEILPGAEALRHAGVAPLDIREKDGHAIVVANSLSTGTACLRVEDVTTFIDWSLAAAALNYEAFRSHLSAIDADALGMRPAFGQQEIGARLRAELAGSGLEQSGAARRLQDPLSYRCVPQVWGALLHALDQARIATEIELVHSGDNPAILPDKGRTVAIGNFDLTAFVLAWEHLGQALAHCAATTASRCMRLMSPVASELPRFLSERGQSRMGLAQLQKSMSALEAEIRHLALPISLTPLAVSDSIEDHSSMAPRVVAKIRDIVERLNYLVAIELVSAAVGVDLRGVTGSLGQGTRRTYEAVRALVPPLDEDRELSRDMAGIARLVTSPRA